MRHPFRTRSANYPDLETAIALGDRDWKPPDRQRKQRTDKIENRLWIKRVAEADALLAYVQAHPVLVQHLQTALVALAARKFMPPRSESPPRIVRERFALEQRRRYFTPLFQLALPLYLADHPDAPQGFHDTPRYLSVAFRRLCVREFFRLVHDNPDYLDA